MVFEEDETTRVPAEQRGLRIWSIELVVIEGPSRGLRASIVTGAAKIGTAAGNDLRLVDPTVSRVHCELRVRPDVLSLKDSGSTNGTFVEGIRVREADVPPGSVVRVGSSAFRIDVGDQPVFVDVSSKHAFGELVGSSLEMRRVYAVLERVAPGDTTVLVQGETGTGKDVVARSIHAASKRAQGPFVAVDCGAIPENLMESELFGHVRGAFSGAMADRRGVFEEANGGTLFLDEIGELPIALQPKLLRALETRTIRRVGSNTEKPIDVRLIAATNRPLARCVNDGTFREDLYYRLAVVELPLPPLRSRREDIPLLARAFYAKLAPGGGELPHDFVDMLSKRAWPGNVRELRNAIERAVSLGFVGPQAPRPSRPPPPDQGGVDTIIPLHLPLKDARQVWVERFEHTYVKAMLRKVGGNVTRAAERAGVSRRFLQRMVARLGIKAAEVGADPHDLEGDD
jgi:transcriptional regulator with GAF, ATPase, and Fis domain